MRDRLVHVYVVVRRRLGVLRPLTALETGKAIPTQRISGRYYLGDFGKDEPTEPEY
jgi:hypothetical protein